MLMFLLLIGSYTNVSIMSVTVASVKRSFSKLKLLKNYLKSTMSQERLNGMLEETFKVLYEIFDMFLIGYFL
jgi:hypothetical protein